MNLKPWMKTLMWVFLGGGIGFFAGYQVGNERGNKRLENIQMNEWSSYEGGYNQALRDSGMIKNSETWEDVKKNLQTYIDGDFDVDSVEALTEEEIIMPEDEPKIGDEEDIEEIPEPHPQYFIPEQISEEEYYNDPWGYDQEHLYFYELDEVLYNKETKKAIANKDEMDQIIGIGMTFNFYKSDGEVLDAIFVKNDTNGVIYRIDRLDAAYMDEIVGKDAPEYLEDE